VWRRVDAVLYPSQQEVDRVSALEPKARVHVVQPYAFARVAATRTAPSGAIVVFVAGFAHPPNEDAAIWLVREIMPRVRQLVPNATLAIVGSHPTARVRALADATTTIHADVTGAELQAWYARARVAVVPLRQGAGVKRKVVEAMSEGLPLVTTPVGAQGLPDIEAAAAVCSTPDTIANAVVTLLRNDALWRMHSNLGANYVSARFSPDSLRASLLAAIPLSSREAPSLSVRGATPLSLRGAERRSNLADHPQEQPHALPSEPAQHRQSLFQIGDEVLHVLQPDMQPDHRSLEPSAGGAGNKPRRGQRKTFEAAPGGPYPEQRERFDERMRALG
jgi:hypothetical protein